MRRLACLASRCLRHGVATGPILVPSRRLGAADRVETLCTCKPTQKYVCPPQRERKTPWLRIALLLALGALGGAFYVANYCRDTMDELWVNDSPLYPYLTYLVLEKETEADKIRKKKLLKSKFKKKHD